MKRWMIHVLAACFLTGCVAAAPLPDDVKITAPREKLPSYIANYIGVWERIEGGVEGGTKEPQALTIVIEEIKLPNVTAIYSWGDRKGTSNGGWLRVNGTITGKTIVLKWKTRFGRDRKVTIVPGDTPEFIKASYEKTPGKVSRRSILKKKST